MNTQRLAGMVGILVVVTLGVVGVDRWTKDARARHAGATTIAKNEIVPLTGGRSTIHYQVDPIEPIPLPAPPTEDKQPPLTSTGELEKQLKESLEKLQKALPSLPGAEESSPPLPEPSKADAEKKTLPPLPSFDPPTPGKDASIPKLPPLTNLDAQPTEAAAQPKAEPTSPPPPAVTAPPSETSQAGKKEDVAVPSRPAATPPMPATPREKDEPKSLTPIPATPLPPPDAGTVRNVSANVAPQEDFQKRLTDIEVKYLKDMVAELERRVQQMPQGDLERRKLETEHQRVNERLQRLMKAVEWSVARKLEDRSGMAESPWVMNLETVEGRTVLHATVHRKARFKVVCERLDLQTPRGTLLAVGMVQISGEGFQASCDRLSIPLNDDRLVLEGKAEVTARTQPMLEAGNKEQPPKTEPRRLEGQNEVPMQFLHLKGDHLDLHCSDSRVIMPTPTEPGSERSSSSSSPSSRSTPIVKTGFATTGQEKWSAWGVLLALPAGSGEKNGPRDYVIQTRDGQILAFVRAPASLSLNEYIGKRVSVFGVPMHESGRPAPTFSASHVAWE